MAYAAHARLSRQLMDQARLASHAGQARPCPWLYSQRQRTDTGPTSPCHRGPTPVTYTTGCHTSSRWLCNSLACCAGSLYTGTRHCTRLSNSSPAAPHGHPAPSHHMQLPAHHLRSPCMHILGSHTYIRAADEYIACCSVTRGHSHAPPLPQPPVQRGHWAPCRLCLLPCLLAAGLPAFACPPNASWRWPRTGIWCSTCIQHVHTAHSTQHTCSSRQQQLC